MKNCHSLQFCCKISLLQCSKSCPRWQTCTFSVSIALRLKEVLALVFSPYVLDSSASAETPGMRCLNSFFFGPCVFCEHIHTHRADTQRAAPELMSLTPRKTAPSYPEIAVLRQSPGSEIHQCSILFSSPTVRWHHGCSLFAQESQEFYYRILLKCMECIILTCSTVGSVQVKYVLSIIPGERYPLAFTYWIECDDLKRWEKCEKQINAVIVGHVRGLHINPAWPV